MKKYPFIVTTHHIYQRQYVVMGTDADDAKEQARIGIQFSALKSQNDTFFGEEIQSVEIKEDSNP